MFPKKEKKEKYKICNHTTQYIFAYYSNTHTKVQNNISFLHSKIIEQIILNKTINKNLCIRGGRKYPLIIE